MKKTYIIPSTTIVALSMTDGVLNNVSANGTVTINPGTISGGNGGDATKTSGDWSDIWNNK